MWEERGLMWEERGVMWEEEGVEQESVIKLCGEPVEQGYQIEITSIALIATAVAQTVFVHYFDQCCQSKLNALKYYSLIS